MTIDPDIDRIFNDYFNDTPVVEASSELVSLDELVDSQDEPYDWLIPGLIERCDRMLLTGLEGGGKSTLARQIASQAAHGTHPFETLTYTPIRALIVDCENSKRQVRRKADILRKRSGVPLHFVFRPDGIDLTIVQHVAWLENIIKQSRPELLVIGPVYKMAGGDPKDEQNAKAVATTLDHLRIAHQFALIAEAHTPYADGSKSKRPERPYGASLWSRWPEFGIYLAQDGTLRHWRGQRDERQWPQKLRRGQEWPWEVEISADVETTWEGPTKCMTAVVDFFRTAGTVEYSGNQLAVAMKAVGTAFRRETIGLAAEQLVAEGRLNVRTGARSSRLYSHNDNPSQQTTDHGTGHFDGPF